MHIQLLSALRCYERQRICKQVISMIVDHACAVTTGIWMGEVSDCGAACTGGGRRGFGGGMAQQRLRTAAGGCPVLAPHPGVPS